MIQRKKFFISLGLVFAAGLLVGILAGMLFGERHFMDRFRKGPKKEHVVNHLASELKLSTEQKESLKIALDEEFTRMEAFRSEVRKKMQESKERTMFSIKPPLSEEQRKLLEELDKRMPMPGGSPDGRRGDKMPPPPF